MAVFRGKEDKLAVGSGQLAVFRGKEDKLAVGSGQLAVFRGKEDKLAAFQLLFFDCFSSIANCRLPTAYLQSLPIANCQLPTPYCLLPTTAG